MSQSSFSPAKIAIESAAIFFSVILAFAVEQWRDDHNERQQAAATLNLVKVELQENLAELESVITSRDEELSQYIDAVGVLQDENRFPQNLPRLQIPEITRIAYELATDSGAVAKVEPAELIVVARAYEALEEVRSNERSLDERNAQIRFNDGEQYLSGFIYYLNRAQIAEPSAVAHVSEAIAVLESR